MKKIAIATSVFFVALAGVHTFMESVEVDLIAIVLLVLASLPWLSPFLKSLELPGGVKIELKDVMAATQQIEAGLGEDEAEEEQTGEYDYLTSVAEHDANLALVAIRIEIEKNLRGAFGQSDRPIPLSRMVNELARRGQLPSQIAGGLMELVQIGNEAAHGVTVSNEAADWVLSEAPNLLSRLKEELRRDSQPSEGGNSE